MPGSSSSFTSESASESLSDFVSASGFESRLVSACEMCASVRA